MPVRAEIDAVVVAPHALTIWVLEAKDLAVSFSPRRIRSELDKYLRTGGHVDKILAKVGDVATNPTAVAARLGMTGEARAFTVRGLFVTRELSPAACVDDSVHDFVTVDRLPGFLLNRPLRDSGGADSPTAWWPHGGSTLRVSGGPSTYAWMNQA